MLFDWTAEITGTRDRSEYKVLSKVVIKYAVTEALMPPTVFLLC